MDIKEVEIEIHANMTNWKMDVVFLLFFEDPNNTRLFNEQFPTVWKVLHFKKGMRNKETVKYRTQLAFSTFPNTEEGEENVEIVVANTAKEISNGQTAKIFENNINMTDPVINEDFVEVTNSTNGEINLCFGFLDSENKFFPTVIQKEVRKNKTAVFDTAPYVSVYVTEFRAFLENEEEEAQSILDELGSPTSVATQPSEGSPMLEETEGSPMLEETEPPVFPEITLDPPYLKEKQLIKYEVEAVNIWNENLDKLKGKAVLQVQFDKERGRNGYYVV